MANSEQRPRLLGLRHVALYTGALDACERFWIDIMGYWLEWKPDADNVYLTSGYDNLALHKLPPGAEPGPVQIVHHIGFIVRRPENVDEWAERIRNLGIPLAQEPRTHRDGARSIYFHDPDGLLIQLLYHPPISDRPR